jgi:hypothetical protein
MFPTALPTSPLAAQARLRARETWREAASLVSVRWQVFLDAEAESRAWAFASYLAALDAEEAAVGDMAALSARIAA